MRRINLLLIIFAVVAAPAALAQCPVSREFGGLGNGNVLPRIKIDTATNGFPNDGNELASIYIAEFPGNNNGGDHFGGPNSCPTAGWYLTGGMFLGLDAGIQGFHSTGGCNTPLCPAVDESLVVVVEDTNGAEAGFICYSTDGTPQEIRYYDHAATEDFPPVGPSFLVHTFERFPSVHVTRILGRAPDATAVSDYRDLGLNAHVALAGQPAAPAGCLQSYDIMMFHGAADPGRNRSIWTLVESIPYAGAAVKDHMVDVPCPTTANDTFLAVGATYVGGVQSLLVGSPAQLECDPNLAQPDLSEQDKRKPHNRRRMRSAGRGR